MIVLRVDGEAIGATETDAVALLDAALANGFHYVTEVLGTYLLANDDTGQTATMAIEQQWSLGPLNPAF